MLQDGQAIQETRLGFAGQTSTFTGLMTPSKSGPATLEVLAMQPETANFGWVRKELKVGK